MNLIVFQADNLVCVEKIGSGNYYWSFTSSIINHLNELNTKKRELEKEVSELEKKISAESKKNPDNAERKKLLKNITDSELENRKLKEQEALNNRLNPETLLKKKNASITCKTAVNRWTENIFAIRSYCRDTFNISDDDFNKQFGIPQNFDFIE